MSRRLRIVTYNVHSCFGTDRKLDPARLAAVIAECEADIVALQEVDVARARSGGIDQAETIAKHLSMASHFHPALHLEEERYGDALLTALPTRLVKAGGLPSHGEARGALWVEVPFDGYQLEIFVTHLGLLGRDRVQQTEALLGPTWLGGTMPVNARVILAGDLNAITRSTSYKILARKLADAQCQTCRKPKPTFPSRFPLLRIDHLFVGEGIKVLDTFVHRSRLARVASDHLPLCADLEIT